MFFFGGVGWRGAQRRTRPRARRRTAPVLESQALNEAHRDARADDPLAHGDARPGMAVDDRTEDTRERDGRAHGQVDAARHDHEQLTERQERDHGRLGEDVADVAPREEDRRRQADDDDQ